MTDRSQVVPGAAEALTDGARDGWRLRHVDGTGEEIAVIMRTTTTDTDHETSASTAGTAPLTSRARLDREHREDVARRAQRRELRRQSVLHAVRTRPVAAVSALVTALGLAAGGALVVATGGAAGATVNVAVNGGFETSTTGWTVSGGGHLGLTNGHDSKRAAVITNVSGRARTIALNDRRNTIRTTVKGQTYEASAWVRALRRGQSVSLRIMEFKGTTFLGQARKNIWLTNTGWHRVAVSYTATADGAMLDLNVVDWKMPAGARLAVDDISMVVPVAVANVDPTPADTPTTQSPLPVNPADVPVATDPTTPAPEPSTSSPAPVTPVDPAPSGWKLAWADEFDGTAVDSAKWNVRNNTSLSYDLAYLTKNNVAVHDGSLFITAKRQTLGGRDYTSGYLDTIGKMSRTYGRFEVRAKLPTADGSSAGLWPAFWLRPDDGGIGEIDIMEAVGPTGIYKADMSSQTIWYDYNKTYPKEVHVDHMPAPQVTAGWHTYAVEWTPTSMTWYVDSRVVYTRSTATTSWFKEAFSRNFNIRLNLQVGGSWPGSPTASTDFSQSYQVDYVRVYSAA